MDNIEIRRALAEDLPVMQDIARRTIDQCYRCFLGDEGVDWFIDSGESDEEIERHLDECDVLLSEGAVVAFAVFFNDLIYLMMVDVALHPTGIGSKLLSNCENQLFAKGHSRIRLETFEGNHQAIRFYTKNGWSISGRSKDDEHGFVKVLFEKAGGEQSSVGS